MFKNTLPSLRKGPSLPRSQVSDKTSPNIKAMAEPAAAARHTEARPAPTLFQRLRARWRARMEEPAKGPVYLAITSLAREAKARIPANDILPHRAADQLTQWLHNAPDAKLHPKDVGRLMQAVNRALATLESDAAQTACKWAEQARSALEQVVLTPPQALAVAALGKRDDTPELQAFRQAHAALKSSLDREPLVVTDKAGRREERRQERLHTYRVNRYFDAIGERRLFQAATTPEEKTRLFAEQRRATRHPHRNNEFRDAGIALHGEMLEKPMVALNNLRSLAQQFDKAVATGNPQLLEGASAALIDAHKTAIDELTEHARTWMCTHELSMSLLPSERRVLREYGQSILKGLIPYLTSPDTHIGIRYRLANMACSGNSKLQEAAMNLLPKARDLKLGKKSAPRRVETSETSSEETSVEASESEGSGSVDQARIDPESFEVRPLAHDESPAEVQPDDSDTRIDRSDDPSPQVPAPSLPPIVFKVRPTLAQVQQRIAEAKIQALEAHLETLQASQNPGDAPGKSEAKRTRTFGGPLSRQADKANAGRDPVREAQSLPVQQVLDRLKLALARSRAQPAQDEEPATVASILAEYRNAERSAMEDLQRTGEIWSNTLQGDDLPQDKLVEARRAESIALSKARIHAALRKLWQEAQVQYRQPTSDLKPMPPSEPSPRH